MKPKVILSGHPHFKRFAGRLFFSVLAFCFLLFAVAGGPASAQTAPLSAAEIATIEDQRVRADAAAAAMDRKLQCFVDQDAQYEARSRTLEKQTGDLHRAEEAQRQTYTVAKNQVDGLSGQVEDLRRTVAASQNEMASLNARLKAANAALRKCKDKLWILGFTCDIAGEISGLNSDIRNMEARQRASGIRLQSAQSNYAAAAQTLEQARVRYSAAQTALQLSRASIDANEAELTSIKAALSGLRTTKQGYATTQSNFATAYDDFKTLDPSSDRRFVIRQLRAASQDMAVALPAAEAAINDGGLLLPSGTRICTG